MRYLAIACLLAILLTSAEAQRVAPGTVQILGDNPIITLDVSAILDLPSSTNSTLIPESTDIVMQFVEAIPLEAKANPELYKTFQLMHKGQPWLGDTTVFMGMEIANIYSLLQHPGKYTAGEWVTWAGLAGAAYLVGEDQDWWSSGSSSSGGGSSRNDSNLGDVSGPGGNTTTFGNIINSTVQVIQGSNDPVAGEGGTATFDQGTSNSDGTVSDTP